MYPTHLQRRQAQRHGAIRSRQEVSSVRTHGCASARECHQSEPTRLSRVATEFDANLQLRSTAEGGRETALLPGYRSIVRFGDADSGTEAWGVEITFDGKVELAPGESAVVRMYAWGDPPPPRPGTAVRLYEGARLVGSGIVRE